MAASRSPTQRSLEYLREQGYHCEVVEKWNSWTKQRKDLWGWCDILAIRKDEVLAVQVPAADVAKRIRKIQESETVALVQAAEQFCDRVSIKRELLDREADSLSGGEAQRMVIARALAAQPQVLLADEPTSALDGDATERMEALALSLLGQGIAVVWVTHDRAQIRRLAQHLVVLKSGELLFSGSADDPDAASAIDESWFNKE